MAPGLSVAQRSERDTTPDVLPASQYLQERLLERRSKNTRPKQLRQSDFGPRSGGDDDIFANEADASKYVPTKMVDSSPLLAASRHGSRTSDSNKRRGLGARGMEEQMDRLTKENFALKLELDHRRDHTAKLQESIDAMRAQVERAEQLHEEHTELLRINSQLVEELEKRDKAVEEAMDIICDLEDKVADMEERRSSNTRPSTANPDSGYAGTETYEHASPSSQPEAGKVPKTPRGPHGASPAAASAATNRLLSAVNESMPVRPRREPNVLSQKKQSTHALRSVFLEATQSLHPVQSFNSLLTRQESRADDEVTLSSPRLSVLSESSFPSIYSPKKHVSPDRFPWENEDDEETDVVHGPSPHLRQDSIKRVSQWMDERDLPEDTPSKSNKITSPLSQRQDADMSPSPVKSTGRDTAYRSRGDPLSADPASTKHMQLDVPEDVQYIKPFPIRTARHGSKSPRPTAFGGPIFGEPLLPPTPDSASTRMLRRSRSSIADDKSLPDTTSAAVKVSAIFEPGVRTAPQQMRSSVELNSAYQSYMQRREENDVDDDEQDDDADAGSDTIRDLSMEYDGFPDGGSILMGTPSRFLIHGNPRARYVPYDGYGLSTPEVGHPPFARRQTTLDATSSRKPGLGRAETSPSLQHAYGSIITTTGLPTSAGSITSPRSYHSGSSSNKTIIQTEGRESTMSPDLHRMDSYTSTAVASPPGSRASPSPPRARTLSSKAHGLLRRLSNPHRGSGYEREKSPLPTLTTAPSSLYINDIPKEVRRPGTGYGGGDTVAQIPQQPMHAAERRRPSMQTRTKTAPANAATRSLSPPIPDRNSLDTERKNLFRRETSTMKGPYAPNQDATNSITQEGSGMKGMISRRRGSIKEAVNSATGKRRWR